MFEAHSIPVTPDVFGHELNRSRWIGQTGRMRRNSHIRMPPERVWLGQWLGFKYVKCRTTDMPLIERTEQIFLADKASASGIDNTGTTGQLSKRPTV
mgnify:CR=1 FL=1